MMNKEKIKLKESTFVLVIIILGIVGYLYFKNNRNQIIQEGNLSYNIAYFENQKSSYGLRVLPIDTDEGEGAELVVYFDKNSGDTKTLEASYGGETFHVQYSYYFNDINNFFMIETIDQWDRPYSEENRVQTNHEVNKYYFKKVSLVQWINSENVDVPPGSEEFNKKQKEILEQLDGFMKVVSTKNP